jgi:hypothetical protein
MAGGRGGGGGGGEDLLSGRESGELRGIGRRFAKSALTNSRRNAGIHGRPLGF